jgi:hypothetical protein
MDLAWAEEMTCVLARIFEGVVKATGDTLETRMVG